MAAHHRSPVVAYFVGWGCWKRLATALEYALGYSDPAVVSELRLPWPADAAGLVDNGLVDRPVVMPAVICGEAMSRSAGP